MAFGMGEDVARSPMTHVDSATFPVSPGELAEVAEDNGAPPDVINLLKSLPAEQYESREQVQRDLAEAARRLAMGLSRDEDEGEAIRDRRNIGRDAVEGAPEGMTRHP